jgi:prepilin-type N-terminal cleavage/methylation domain-containing protein
MKQKNKKNINFKRKGFTIIEVLISTAVVSIGLVGILQLMSNNIRTSIDSRNQIIAAGLSQEGLELILDYKKNSPATLALSSGPGSVLCTDLSNSIYLTSCSPLFSNMLNYSVFDPKHYEIGAGGESSGFRREVWLNPDSNIGPAITYYDLKSIVTWNDTPIPVLEANCTIAKKCVISKVILQR